jgi:hypothetical protein
MTRMRPSVSLKTVFGLMAAIGLTLALLGPLVSNVRQRRQDYRHVDHVRRTILSLHGRCPPEVPAVQWKEAIDWTANVIGQDFFVPRPEESMGLQELSQGLDLRVQGEVDLATLQWVWDECARVCGGPDSYGIRFRNVRLLTQEPITDASLPEVWSLDRCLGLDLSQTPITDVSIPLLSQLRQLRHLDLRGTQLTAAGVERIRRALPGCEVLDERGREEKDHE